MKLRSRLPDRTRQARTRQASTRCRTVRRSRARAETIEEIDPSAKSPTETDRVDRAVRHRARPLRSRRVRRAARCTVRGGGQTCPGCRCTTPSRPPAPTGELTSTGSLHLLSAVTHVPELAFLVDHPGAFRYVWSVLGWNTHIYHSHVSMFTRRWPDASRSTGTGTRTAAGRTVRWTGSPRPRLSVKVSYWLSDVTRSGRGNLTVIPVATCATGCRGRLGAM